MAFSLGIMAWNEEDAIGLTLESLFQQTIFAQLGARGERCEVVCLANGCTDRTVAVVRDVFARMTCGHRQARAFTARVAEIPEPGRNNAWNRFVHEFSAPEARFIALMDADIAFLQPETLHRLMTALEQNPRAVAATGRQCKDLLFKEHKTLRDRISLATSDMTGTITGQICGQLYCLRADTARRLYLPRDLGAPDDGFLKAVLCTDFLTREPEPGRIILAPGAGHVYEAYVSVRDVLNNQKRQMIGQTTVHVLIEHLKTLPAEERANLADTLWRKERSDPDWLKKLLDQHLRRKRFFWQLFPGLLTFRFQRLLGLKGPRKLLHLPAALAGFAVTLIACRQAHRFLKQGRTHYWPKAGRQTILNVHRTGVK